METFKRCLRRFIARRGIPALIVSDNAKTFKGTEKQLRTLFRHPQVREEMQNHRIEWRFNLERAPWWGGFFERMVGCVKRCLKKVLGNARLTYDELLRGCPRKNRQGKFRSITDCPGFPSGR